MKHGAYALVTATLGAGLLAVAGGLIAGPVQAQQPSIVGSWQSTVNQGPGRPNLRSLHTYTADGGFIGTYTIPVTTQPQTRGSGSEAHGSWRQIGPGRFALHAVGLEIDPQGRFGGLFKVNATITVGGGGNTFHGQETFTLGAPGGRVVASGRATFTGTRISP